MLAGEGVTSTLVSVEGRWLCHMTGLRFLDGRRKTEVEWMLGLLEALC